MQIINIIEINFQKTLFFIAIDSVDNQYESSLPD